MTLRNLLERTTSCHPNSIALRYWRNDVWHTRTYAELCNGVRQIAKALSSFNLVNQTNNIALMLENCPEWMESYLAIAGYGGVVVPIDPKLCAPEVAFILKDVNAVAIITDTHHRVLLEQILPNLPTLSVVIIIDGGNEPLAPIAERPCYDYDTLRAEVKKTPPTGYAPHQPAPHDIASIIYTSGTTGNPKGVMLTHLNFCSNALGSLDVLKDVITAKDDFLIVLPLFHAFSFTANFVIPLAKGCRMSFVQNLRSLKDDLKTLRPTILMTVPLLAEKILIKIEPLLSHHYTARLLSKFGLGCFVRMQIRRELGGHIRFLFVGGAPCPQHVLNGFRRLGVPIIEGYGLTECSPVVSLTPFNTSHVGTVGKKLPNIEVRIAEVNEQGVGELQVRGPIVMKGYYHNLAATREVFDGEWLRTGDLASIDSNSYISICGRKKALIVNREGKNIYPEEVENVIACDPLIADIVVLGYTINDLPGERVSAIVIPNLEAIQAAHAGYEPPWGEVTRLICQCVHTRCKNMAEYKHPRKIEVRREPLERTSTHKIRRCLYQGQLNEH